MKNEIKLQIQKHLDDHNFEGHLDERLLVSEDYALADYAYCAVNVSNLPTSKRGGYCATEVFADGTRRGITAEEVVGRLNLYEFVRMSKIFVVRRTRSVTYEYHVSGAKSSDHALASVRDMSDAGIGVQIGTEVESEETWGDARQHAVLEDKNEEETT